MEEVEELIGRAVRTREIKPLGKTFGLEFHLIPDKDGDHPLSTRVSAAEYAVHTRIEKGGTTVSFDVQGELELVDGGDDPVMLHFHSFMEFDGKDGSGHVGARGSSLVPIGKPITLAELGEKALVVTITVDRRKDK